MTWRLLLFFSYLFGDIPARFPSDFPLSESVTRLQKCTKRSVFSSLFREAAVGPVTESRVRLQRVIPLFGNSFKPIFVGRFHHSQGRVVLEGRFTMFSFAKVFMTGWLAFALIWTALAAFATLKAVSQTGAPMPERSIALLLPLIGVVFFAMGIAIVRVSWWLSRNDMAFLASVIRRALTSATPGPGVARQR